MKNTADHQKCSFSIQYNVIIDFHWKSLIFNDFLGLLPPIFIEFSKIAWAMIRNVRGLVFLPWPAFVCIGTAYILLHGKRAFLVVRNVFKLPKQFYFYLLTKKSSSCKHLSLGARFEHATKTQKLGTLRMVPARSQHPRSSRPSTVSPPGPWQHPSCNDSGPDHFPLQCVLESLWCVQYAATTVSDLVAYSDNSDYITYTYIQKVISSRIQLGQLPTKLLRHEMFPGIFFVCACPCIRIHFMIVEVTHEGVDLMLNSYRWNSQWVFSAQYVSAGLLEQMLGIFKSIHFKEALTMSKWFHIVISKTHLKREVSSTKWRKQIPIEMDRWHILARKKSWTSESGR